MTGTPVRLIMPGPDSGGRAAPEGPPQAAKPTPQVTRTQAAPATTQDSPGKGRNSEAGAVCRPGGACLSRYGYAGLP